jgi:hypothetical protein
MANIRGLSRALRGGEVSMKGSRILIALGAAACFPAAPSRADLVTYNYGGEIPEGRLGLSANHLETGTANLTIVVDTESPPTTVSSPEPWIATFEPLSATLVLSDTEFDGSYASPNALVMTRNYYEHVHGNDDRIYLYGDTELDLATTLHFEVFLTWWYSDALPGSGFVAPSFPDRWPDSVPVWLSVGTNRVNWIGTLSVSSSVAPVSEPASWLPLAFTLPGLISAFRRRSAC